MTWLSYWKPLALVLAALLLIGVGAAGGVWIGARHYRPQLDRAAQDLLEDLPYLVGVPGHVHVPPGKGVDQGDVPGCLVGAAGPCGVVGGSDTDQDRSHALVSQIEFELFQGPFDEERCVAVRDRTQSAERESSSDPDEGLFTDAHVDDACGVASGGPAEPVAGDDGCDDRDAGIAVEGCLGRGDEGLAHGRAFHRGGVGITHDRASPRVRERL